MLDRLLEQLGGMLEYLGEVMSVENGYFWMLLGLILVLVEAVLGAATALALGSIGVAAFLTGVVAFLGLHSLIGLIIVFIIISLALFFLSRPLTKRLMGDDLEETNVDAMAGKLAVVTEAIGGLTAPGRVKIAGDRWRSLPAENKAIPEGTAVRVLRVEGATLIVEIESTKEEE